MRGINLLSCCFSAQWKFNLRSRPSSAGSGRGKKSTNGQLRGSFLVPDLRRKFLPSVQRLESVKGGSVQWRGRWIGCLLPPAPLSYCHPGICPVPSKDESRPHPPVSDTRCWCCPRVMLRPLGTSQGSLSRRAVVSPSHLCAIQWTLLWPYLTSLLCVTGGIQVSWILQRICPGDCSEGIKLQLKNESEVSLHKDTLTPNTL